MNKNDHSELTTNKKRKIDENSVLSEMNIDNTNVSASLSQNHSMHEPLPSSVYHNTVKSKYTDIEMIVRDLLPTRRVQTSGDFKYLNVLLPSGRDIKLKMHSKDSDVLKYVKIYITLNMVY